MPSAPLRRCAGSPFCPNYAGQSPEHKPRERWQAARAQPRIRGRRLQRLREQLFNANPLCALCAAAGRVSLAVIRDHIVPIAEGGTDDPTNIQGLCGDCSRRKTHAESVRGKARFR